MIEIDVLTLSTSKLGEPLEASADRFSSSRNGTRHAIADGVSRSYSPATWAEALTQLAIAVRGIPSTDEIRRLAETHFVSADVEDWIESELRSRGSHSTLIYCELDVEIPLLRASSVGDSLVAVFGVDGWCTDTWPFIKETEFPKVPDALCSIPPFISGAPRTTEMALPQRGVVLLMTDALGRYIRGYLDRKMPATGDLLEALPFFWAGFFGSEDPEFDDGVRHRNFCEWVEAAKEQGALEDDDITLVAILFSYRKVRST